MNNKLSLVFVVAVLLGTAVLASVSVSRKGYAQEPATSSSLTFTMTPAQQNVLLLEPIVLRFGLANNTEQPLPMKGFIALHTIKLHIKKPSGEVITPEHLSNGSSGSVFFLNQSTEYKPGAEKKWNEHLEYNLGEYFDEVGEYQIKATYDNAPQSLSTDWVSLSVEQPTGADVRAYEFLKEGEKRVFQNGKKDNRLAFIQRFPDSRYADYSRYFAARGLAGNNADQAIELLQGLQGKDGFVFAVDAENKLKELKASKEKTKRSEN
jgi:hypothetical protein